LQILSYFYAISISKPSFYFLLLKHKKINSFLLSELFALQKRNPLAILPTHVPYKGICGTPNKIKYFMVKSSKFLCFEEF